MIDLIPLIGKIAPACIKKFLSYLRNRPYAERYQSEDTIPDTDQKYIRN